MSVGIGTYQLIIDFSDLFLVYISKNGSRSKDCGSIENPCQRIDDVLFDRKTPVTIYLEASTEVKKDFEENLSRQRRDNVSSNSNTTAADRYVCTTPQPVHNVVSTLI